MPKSAQVSGFDVAARNYKALVGQPAGDTFPVGSGEESVEAVLVHLGRSASDEEVLAEMDRQGLRPATMAEFSAFGSQYPDQQREFPVVVFGPVWAFPRGYRLVGYHWGLLGRRNGRRKLHLHRRGSDWLPSCRFLAVRK